MNPERRTAIIIVLAAFIVVLCTLMVAVLAITEADAANRCPAGHTIAADQPGPYYVYAPNLPGGYSAVWVNDSVTLLPPPGTYGELGDRIIVCYTDDIYAFAAQLTPTTTTTTTAVPVTETPACTVAGVPGILHPDGTCWTPERYDATFSPEALAEIPSHTDPGRSVADVYNNVLSVASAAPASERPRYFHGIELPPFAVIVAGVHAAL